MRSLAILITTTLCAVCVLALLPERWLDGRTQQYDLPRAHESKLTIYSTTDKEVFRPVIADFNNIYPRIKVTYFELEASELNDRFVNEERDGKRTADLLLSSAMDLQVKLVNDGYGMPHRSADGAQLPAWARWRDEAFGITFEPAVMVFNTGLISGQITPKSRSELVNSIKSDPGFWNGRIGTYDIERSSVGYLLASEDARQNSDFGLMLETLGGTHLKRYNTTSDLLNALESGKLALGYNLLGSYARTRIEAGAPLQIVYPEDYTLSVSRTAMISRSAPHPREAHVFLEYLLSLRGQRVLTVKGRLSAVRPEIEGEYSRIALSERQIGPFRPIALGPGLLAYRDQQKYERLIESWRRSLDLERPSD